MPFDQSAAVPNVVPASGLPRAANVLIAGLVCLALAIAITHPGWRLGLAICSATLCLLTLVIAWLNQVRRQSAERLRHIAQQMLAHEKGIGFVTDEAGVIHFANAAANAQFGEVSHSLLTDVFGRMLANPKGILSQLVRQAQQTGAQTEDIVTRGGHFRLSLLILAQNCQLWRLDDLSDGHQPGLRHAKAPEFPMMTVDVDGRITNMNEDMRRLVGSDSGSLGQVIDDLPLRSGTVHQVRTHEGTRAIMVVAMQRRDQMQDVFVLPGAQIPQVPRQLEVGWDAIEDLPVPMLRVARDGAVLASNREARQLLNIRSGSPLKLSDVLDGPGRPINDWLTEALAGHDGQASQFLRGRGDRQDQVVQVTLNTAGDDDDPHLIAVLNDVTELKTLEANFVQSQKMQAIGQLAGGVAHDFNNLLTAISGHCDLLLLRHNEGDQNYGDLMQIHQNANRAAGLVGQLLAFSRKQNLQLETIDLRDTLSELTYLLNRLVGEKVTLSLDHDPALHNIRADKRQLEQVLMNLIVNARDAMEGAGEIKVVTQNVHFRTHQQRDRATVPAGEYVQVKVIDHGCGIAPEKLSKVFEPFYTTKKIGEGTGLGLSTAYGIVKQTSGYIFVDTEVGTGTTFTLLFPRHQISNITATSVSPDRIETLNTAAEGVVLLVEDEAPVRAFASRALRLRGYTVVEADCGEAALKLLEDAELTVDIFVTDVIMPGMDGPTWVREARKKRPGTKVVFVSGYPEDAFEDGQPAIDGAVFLPKPFSLKALTETVYNQAQGELEEA